MGIPYTHSGVVASSVAMNKVMSRQLFRVGGIAVPTRLSLQEDNGVLIPQNYEGAYVVKPINEGSSFGVKIIHEGEAPATHDAWPVGTIIRRGLYSWS